MSQVADTWLRVPPRARQAGVGLAVGVGFAFVMQLVFGANARTFANGISVGALYGLLAMGLILIYRSSRIINFAGASLGSIPAIALVLLQINKGLPYWIAFPGALIGSAAIGALVEVSVVRRFAKAPRLILTVATIGVAQLLALFGFFVRDWIGRADKFDYSGPTPWKDAVQWYRNGKLILNGNQIFTVFIVALAAGGLTLFFKKTRMGIAVRATAENADRAGLLGIPVNLVGTVAWAIAGLFAGLGIFVRSSLIGVPLDGSLGYGILVFALAAATVARMENNGVALLAGMGVGVIEQAATEKTGSGNLATALMLVVILLGLLSQRARGGRALDVGSLTFQTVREFRPIPTELRELAEVRLVRTAFYVLVGAVVLGAPYVVGEPRVGKLTLLPIEAMVAVSLVILTGWAGQISLGHYGIVGLAGAVAGGLAARADQDFFVTLLAGILAGAVVAVLIGLPALRVPGLYLAVTTLAFAAATENYFLRPDFPVGKRILPAENTRIGYPFLFGRIDLEKPRTFYYLCVVGLAAALLVAASFRRHHSGRVIIAVRDNQRAAPAYTINLARTKLAAFAVSGGVAAAAGVLLGYQQQVIDAGSYGIGPSVFVFITAVVGGLTSLGGAVLGAVTFRALSLFASDRLALFSTSVGLLVILLFLPGGLAEAIFKARDDLLRKLADRHGILVPSLVADRRVDDEMEDHVIESAEEHVDHAGSFEGPERHLVRCPVCATLLEPDAAPLHEHLMVGPDDLVPSGNGHHDPSHEPAGDPDPDLVAVGGAGEDAPARPRRGRRGG